MQGIVTGDILIAAVKEVRLYPDEAVYPSLSLFPDTNMVASDRPNIAGGITINSKSVEGSLHHAQTVITGGILIVRER